MPTDVNKVLEIAKKAGFILNHASEDQLNGTEPLQKLTKFAELLLDDDEVIKIASEPVGYLKFTSNTDVVFTQNDETRLVLAGASPVITNYPNIPVYLALKAENDLDAARWRQFRGMVSAKSVAKGDPGVFVIPKIDNILGANLLKGNVAEHFDAAMDVNILMENK